MAEYRTTTLKIKEATLIQIMQFHIIYKNSIEILSYFNMD